MPRGSGSGSQRPATKSKAKIVKMKVSFIIVVLRAKVWYDRRVYVDFCFCTGAGEVDTKSLKDIIEVNPMRVLDKERWRLYNLHRHVNPVHVSFVCSLSHANKGNPTRMKLRAYEKWEAWDPNTARPRIHEIEQRKDVSWLSFDRG